MLFLKARDYGDQFEWSEYAYTDRTVPAGHKKEKEEKAAWMAPDPETL